MSCEVVTVQVRHDLGVWVLAQSPNTLAACNFLSSWLLVQPVSLNHEILSTLMGFCFLTYPSNFYLAFWCLRRTFMVDGLPLMCLEILVYIVFTFILFKFIKFVMYQFLAIPLRSSTALWLESNDRKFHKTAQESLEPRADVPRRSPPAVGNGSLPQTTSQRTQCM